METGQVNERFHAEKEMVMETLFVIGAGTMGGGIAQVAALHGFTVYLYDIKQEFVDKGLKGIVGAWDQLVARGKTAVTVNEYPGFVVNRILIPMINEAVFMLQEGVASAEDIDTAMKLGANHPMGPLALADLIGLDVCLAIMELLRDEMGEGKYRPAPLLRKMVRAGKLGRKSGEGFFRY